MPDAISNSSPLLYLYRIGVINWLPELFRELWVPYAVSNELEEGRRKGYDVPDVANYPWLQKVNPQAMPSEWLSLDLGGGELMAMALALENPARIVLLDDMLARRTAQAAGLTVWGTLKILLEAKAHRLTPHIAPLIDRLQENGMYISSELRHRVIVLSGE